MNDLITVNYENDRPTVSGRELHDFLEIHEKYTQWFRRMCEYGFSENFDYFILSEKTETNNPKNPFTTITNHQLTIEMAKELCMLQRNEKGKIARTYFINLEKAWNTPEMVMSRALQMAQSKIKSLQVENLQQQQIIGELQPKATYVDTILNNKGLVTVTQIAKDYGMSGKKLNEILHQQGVQYKQSGQWLLYSKYHDMGYTHSKTVDITHVDGTKDIKMNTKWTQKGRLFIYETLKQIGILPVIEQGEVRTA
jgi:anti-repressor protein